MGVDMSEVRGQSIVVTLLEYCIVSSQPIMLCGPPGIGKTMIARRVPTIMPRLTEEQQDELNSIYRKARLFLPEERVGDEPPFRAPHHTISSTAMKGKLGYPGESQLAKHGVLFLDEFYKFQPPVLRSIAHGTMVIASALPCPCGYRGIHPDIVKRFARMTKCDCSDESVYAYRLYLRSIAQTVGIHIFVDVPYQDLETFRDDEACEPSESIRERIVQIMSERKNYPAPDPSRLPNI